MSTSARRPSSSCATILDEALEAVTQSDGILDLVERHVGDVFKAIADKIVARDYVDISYYVIKKRETPTARGFDPVAAAAFEAAFKMNQS